ncbi:unnamed protein product [Mesocestoides corti]|uniref:Ig-like domain-containing protein n=1 Tax=Mesocestoides corti TaxID=53468 RepID=A0A0R3U7Y5_MESCO|nr:unnamed protein product [Mesocestoides corti]
MPPSLCGASPPTAGPFFHPSVIPTIVSIPPPVTYLDKSRVSRQESLLTCKVWPPNANLSILSARPQFLSSPQLPFNLGPVPPDSFAVQEAVVADDPEAARPEPSPFSSVVAQLMVSDTSDVWHVDYMDLHCKAATQFGTVVSAPFRVVHASLFCCSLRSSNQEIVSLTEPYQKAFDTILRGGTNRVSSWIVKMLAPRFLNMSNLASITDTVLFVTNRRRCGEFGLVLRDDTGIPVHCIVFSSTGLDDFSMLEGHAVPSDYTNTQVREFIKGNMAFVTCPLPPDSQPPPTVQFYINGSLVNNTQKYKQVRRPNENSVLLLINSFKTSDEGDYRCSLTNPVTGRTVWSPMIVRLQIRGQLAVLFSRNSSSPRAPSFGHFFLSIWPKRFPAHPLSKVESSTFETAAVHRLGIERETTYTGLLSRQFENISLGKMPDKPVPVRLLLPLVSQDNSSALQSRQIVVREGDNVTLLCIMEGAPPPEVRTYPHNQQSGRYIFDEQFGMSCHLAHFRVRCRKPRPSCGYCYSLPHRCMT